MSSIQITDELVAFLKGRLTTADQIEIVLLLLRDPSRSWTASQVSGELGMAPESAAMRSFLLASQGLILFEPSGIPRYRYAGADETAIGSSGTRRQTMRRTARRCSVRSMLGPLPIRSGHSPMRSD